MRLARSDIRPWGAEALPLVDALAGDAFVDLRTLRRAVGPASGGAREVWILWRDGAPAGLVVLDGSAAGTEITIAVVRARRRTGVGSDLLAFARARVVEGRGPLYALVDARNVAACAFFLHHGFDAGETDIDGHRRFEA